MPARHGLLILALATGCGSSAICADGTVEQDGECIPICTEPCGDHQQCVVTETSAQCECVAGYEGNPCEWSGALKDPEFTSPDGWPERTNGATVLPLAAGLVGQGIASFASTVVCNAGAVSQVAEMPPYELADPFVIELAYRAERVNAGIAVGYNRAFRRFRDTRGEWDTARVCLGEAGYGGDVKFQVAISERSPECFGGEPGMIEVDRFEILVADPGECPAPGEVANGDASPGEGDWFHDKQFFLGGGTPESSLVEGVGKEGTGGARIYKPAGVTNRAAIGTIVSVPTHETMPSPALRFWWRGTAGHAAQVEIGTYDNISVSVNGLDTLIADGNEHTYTYCLPPWTHGNVVELAFVQIRVNDAYDDQDSEFVIDAVEVFSDAKCGSNEDVLDPSFDSSPNRWPHSRLARTPADSIAVLDEPELASTGSGVLTLSYGSNQALVAIGTRLWAPPSEGGRGPRAVFYSNVPLDAPGTARWVLGFAGAVRDELLPGGGWRRNEVCLPPEWAERWFRLGVSINNYDEPLVTFAEPTTILLDDFSVGTDESCPAQ
jgi:hypothetical protein